MPGIAGMIGVGVRDEGRATLQRMVESMAHERWDISGTYVDDRVALRVGWVCAKGAFADCLPIWNEAKDICLVFTGESFADHAQVDDLAQKGHRFDSANASCMVHLYEEFGIRFLEKLNGWFSGVLVDLRNDQVVLFNDRYGLGRIYYHENSEGLYFASEAKALLKILPGLRRFDETSLGEVCSSGCALQNRTLFSGVFLLPPGSRWTYSRGQPPRKQTYFDPEAWENQTPLGAGEFQDELVATFKRILPRYLRGPQRIAMSLTGGLDGRMIMAWSPCAPGALPCYTFGGGYRDCADVTIARQVAGVCQQPHEVISVKQDFLAEFPVLAGKAVYVSDGAMDVTGAVNLHANRLARATAPVRLTGNYGSEILRGNVAFKPGGVNEDLFAPELVRRIQDGAATYANEAHGRRLSFIAFKQVPWHHGAMFAVEQSQLALRSPYLDTDLVGLMYRAPIHLAASPEPSLRLIAEGNPALSRIPTDRGVVFRSIPFVTGARKWLQGFALKAEYAYDSGMPQWLARLDRSLAAFHLERVFLGRHKFTHFRIWYRNELSDYVRDILLDPRTLNRPYFQRSSLERMVNGHIRGDGNFTDEIHRALTLELTQSQLIEMD